LLQIIDNDAAEEIIPYIMGAGNIKTDTWPNKRSKWPENSK